MRWEDDLTCEIRIGTEFDDQDGNLPHPMGYNGAIEFTTCNRIQLTEHFMRIKDSCRAILEIGVCRNKDQSSTYCFLNNKKDDTVYVGIDLDDKSFLRDESKQIFTLKASSSDIEDNMSAIRSYGVEQFDFIFIDGWHSTNQVLRDWEYTRYLSDIGIVGFHDVSCHPGPNAFIKNLNRDKWEVEENLCPSDWGIGFAWRKK